MSIPQGLILYRAPKCLENHPINIKQGYYSNKILTSPLYINRQRHANFHRRYQKKFIQEISLKVYCDDKVLETLPKFSSIKKCKFESASESFGREPIKPAAKVFQRIFKVLKRIKRLELPPSGQSEDIAKGFETLLTLNCMESLTLPSLSYFGDDKKMKFLMETVKLASKRRSWLNLKSLDIQLEPPFSGASSPEFDGLFTRSLGELLKFVKELKEYKEISECSNFELNLAVYASMNKDHIALLCEIAKTAPLITSVQGFQMENPESLSEMMLHLKNLKAVGLFLNGDLQPPIDFSVLRKLQNLQELTLADIFLENQLLTQIQSLENLTVLSLGIWEIPENDQKVDLAGVILGLANLKTLKLKFYSQRRFTGETERICLENYPWLGETFQAIGNKPKLEKLSLYFYHFDFENAGQLFKEFCHSLEKLTQLSDFKFIIPNADCLQDEELLLLCESLTKLTEIQNLEVQFNKTSYFDIKTYFALVDRVVTSFPILLRLVLIVSQVKITHEDADFINERFKNKRCKIDALSF